jgi:hypothetical protein
MASRGHAAGESSEGRRNLAQGSSVVFVGCVMVRSTGFQASKVGDMVCVRGPSPHSPAKPRRDAAQMAAVRSAR